MPVLMLLLATGSIVGGSVACAALLEVASFSRRLLLMAVIAPAQVTILTLAIGWLMRSYRPTAMLLGALVLGGAEVVGASTRRRRSSGASARAAIRRARTGLPRHQTITLVLVVATLRIGWQALQAVRLPVTSWDSLMFRLVEPSSWVLSGHVGRSGLTPLGSGVPRGQEVLHGWTIVFLHSIRGTGLVPLWSALVAALAVFRIARHLGAGGSTAALGAGVFCTMPAAALQIGTAHVDLGAAAFGLAALAFALEARDQDEPFGLMVGASTAAGLAIGSRPSMAAVVVVVGATGWILARRRHHRDLSQGALLARGTVGALLVLLLGGVWYLAGFASEGNPLHPFSTLGFDGIGSFEALVGRDEVPQAIRGDNALLQVAHSWTHDLHRHAFAYDQHLGGLGAVWPLVCVPCLGYLGVRLWSRDRQALAMVAFTSVAAAAATRSVWWGRNSLLLAGVGAVAVALTVERLRPASSRLRHQRPRPSDRVFAPALVTAILLLIGVTTWWSMSPTDAYAVDAASPSEPISFSDLATTVANGDGAAVLRPWAAFTGLSSAPRGATIAYVVPRQAPFPQVLMGIDLDHRVVRIQPPAAPGAVAGAMRAVKARYLYLPDPLVPGAVESVAVSDRLHFRRVTADGPIAGGGLWELGAYDECAGGKLTVGIRVRGSHALIGGSGTDACGPLAGAHVELWKAGPVAARPWAGSTQVRIDLGAGRSGAFLERAPRDLVSVHARYFVRFAGRVDHGRYRPVQASRVVTIQRSG